MSLQGRLPLAQVCTSVQVLSKRTLIPQWWSQGPLTLGLFLYLCKHTYCNDFLLFILLTFWDQVGYYPNGAHSPVCLKNNALCVSWWLSNSIDYLYNMMKDFKNFAVMIIGSRIYQGVNQRGLLISISPVKPLQLINNLVVWKGMWSLKINDPIDSTVSSGSIALKLF